MNHQYYETCLKLWAQYNGQKGTPKQIEKLKKSFPEYALDQLERVLKERNVLPLKVGAK